MVYELYVSIAILGGKEEEGCAKLSIVKDAIRRCFIFFLGNSGTYIEQIFLLIFMGEVLYFLFAISLNVYVGTWSVLSLL